MNPASAFFRHATERAGATALVSGSHRVTYGALLEQASRIRHQVVHETDHPLVGVLDDGSAIPYAAILGVLLAGRGYVPLNARFPARRVADMVRRAGVDGIVAPAGADTFARQVQAEVRPGLGILHPGEGGDAPHGPTAVSGRREPVPEPAEMADSTTVYVIFTSGSTGRPKGVVVTARSLAAYLDTIHGIYDFHDGDRFLQLADLTFDLSIFALFTGLSAGATVVVPPPNQRLAPAGMVRRHGITVWCSVPTTAALVRHQGALEPGAFPSLRVSYFCGEALPVDLAEAWSAAAPASTVDNHYGPTETTVSCTWHRWDGDRSRALSRDGIAPLGRCYPGIETVVVDDHLDPVATGELGEICIRGDQVASGYLNDPGRTERSFVSLPWADNRHSGPWYRTGDLARELQDGTLLFAGRGDHQIKLRGYRVELGAVEAAARRHAGVPVAVAVPYPPDTPTAQALVVVVPQLTCPASEVMEGLRQDLAPYMLPNRIEACDIPLNANRKVDRRQLSERVAKMMEDR